jgi:hypothetical protein
MAKTKPIELKLDATKDQISEANQRSLVRAGNDAPTKECPECEKEIHVVSRTCPHCHTVQPATKAEADDTGSDGE